MKMKWLLKDFLNHAETVKSGGMITKIAEYILYVVILVAVIILVVFKKE